ncbi:AAA family ATPase [Archangium lansingense]|uniref:AAA family ATPase n=1 Tax=Archangium lansingense TaxID=2995310 RepID=A0ABT4AC28_9BACT|nr:AAA family ATPase [Archangium lansinium]MCY1079233.1 AAA family ATPase [Archangium lansinium]
MSRLLNSFTYKARSDDSWETAKFELGEALTVLKGPNGSGKTPLIKGLIFGLGYPVELPPDVRANFVSTELALNHGGTTYLITREIDDDFRIRVSEKGASTSTEFRNERDYSLWLLNALSMPAVQLTDKGGNATIPYISVLAPGFYVDQDLGWRSLYAPQRNKVFIKDQEQEVLRVLLGAPPKNPYRNTEEFNDAKREFELIEGQVALRGRLLEKQRKDKGNDEVANLEAKKARLSTELAAYNTGIESIQSSLGRFDLAITEQTEVCNKLQSEISALEGRQRRLAAASSEIASETQLVWLNSIAADAFRTFCGQGNCGLFKNSEESFGRRLLYLKDQIKDIENASSSITKTISLRREAHSTETTKLKNLFSEKEKASQSSGSKNILDSIESITKSLTDISLRLEALKAIESEELTFERLLEQREQLRLRVENSRPTRRSSSGSTSDIRSKLRDNLINWLSILQTPNLTGPAIIDEDFRLFFGEHRFTESSFQGGSTRTRIVLAFHAAVLQTSLQAGGNHPGLLIFDAPKQHELNEQHLAAYLKALRGLSAQGKRPAQIVFSVSDLTLAFGEQDASWQPDYGSTAEPRFFGRTGTKRVPPAK